MTTLFNIYEGAVENAKFSREEVTAGYFSDYAFGAMEIALDDDQIAMLVHFHGADQNSYDEVVAMKDATI